jgi:hypothetical protein
MARPVTTKAKWAILITLTTLIALWTTRPPRQSGSLSIYFAGFTNYEGDHVAVFDLTNHYDVPVYFLVAIERKTAAGWPTYGAGTTMPHTAPTRIDQDPKLEPGETYRLLAIVPTGTDFSAWRVSVGYIPVQPIGNLDKRRQDASNLAADAGLPVLSDVLNPNRGIIVLGPEMHR